MTWTASFDQLSIFILVFCRMGGMIFFNPILARREIPTQVRAGLTLAITLVLAPNLLGINTVAFNTAAAMLFAIMKEMCIGMLLGLIMTIFYYLIFLAGDIMDTSFGLSMSKVFDPSTNIQMSVSGNLMQLCFILYLFLTNSHLLLIRIIMSSYSVVPVGTNVMIGEIGGFIIDVFISTFGLAMQLAIPFMVACFVLEVAMGILMKLVPQISIFTIHFQIKIMLGFILLFAFAGPITEHIQKYMNIMFRSMDALLKALA